MVCGEVWCVGVVGCGVVCVCGEVWYVCGVDGVRCVCVVVVWLCVCVCGQYPVDPHQPGLFAMQANPGKSSTRSA